MFFGFYDKDNLQVTGDMHNTELDKTTGL